MLTLALRTTAWLLAAAWTLKAITVARGLRQVPNLLDPTHDRDPAGDPTVTVIVPARNEAAAIEACLTSLLTQTYKPLHILAVNDRSTDATGALMDTLATAHPERLSVLHITHLPEGWLGKTHAMALAARQALAPGPSDPDRPDWLLFTDGDILFHPDSIRRALALAVEQRADHFVTLPTPIARTPGEAMMLGCLQLLGFWAVRAWRIADPRTRDAVGVGAFNLLTTAAYTQIGGFDALRYQIVEDLALGRRVHRLGLRQRVAFAPGYVSVHWAPGIRGIVNTMTKNLFAVFGYRLVLLTAACTGLLILCVGPVAALALRDTRIPGLIACLAIAAIYRAARSLTGIPAQYAPTFPVATTVLVFACVRSAAITLHAGGVTWRGTFYPLPELRAKAEQL